MAELHPFIYSSSNWIGEGRIIISSSPEHIRFYTKWIVSPPIENSIEAKQLVELHGIQENMVNTFTFERKEGNNFDVILENDSAGIVRGYGFFDKNVISWEFRGNDNFEGFEVYRLEDNGDYMVHSEYVSTDSHRTIIDGRIWHKNS